MGQSELSALEAEIAATTRRLSATVEELSFRLQPRELGRRTLTGAADRASSAARGTGAVVALAGLLLLGVLAAARWHRSRR